ncbi:MAG: phenylalanine--tRNA ligase subunit beta [Gammaproteobacteria bacterium]|nr:phenylalanine--tRNA ligase subunit beta [Gammaproteobacteria bacterium]
MLVSRDWLCDWVAPTGSADALAERLTLGGLEVASVAPAGPALPGVVVGEILRRAPHPNRPSLAVCEVAAGGKKTAQVVCGAANAEAGCKAPLARLGAQLPGGRVGARDIGGVFSEGMLCSAAELGLEEQSEGVMLLDNDAPRGKPLGAYLNLSDRVFELELTPNRGDCLGVLGLAREISALYGGRAKWKGRAVRKIRAQCGMKLPIELRAPRGCPRYAGRAVRGINMRARTPDWMAERLRRGGLRGINIVVDITNYVMLELGQPMHAFDFDKLEGGIVVRRARRGEKLRLLDRREVILDGGDLVIADRKKAAALAGVMGGLDSAIGDATRNVYFESAFFPMNEMRGRARRFGMHTDAAHRFERGVDPGMQTQALERATRLLLATAGGEAGPLTDQCARKWMPHAATVSFDCGEIARLLGIHIPPARARATLERLGMRVSGAGGKWKVRAPAWRFDIEGAHDLVEEIGRVHGFERVPPRMPHASPVASSNKMHSAHSETRVAPGGVKQKLAELGYFEAITYSFVEPHAQQMLLGGGGLALRNPIADNLSEMRRSLWPGLLEAVKTNLNRDHERVRLFESGAVFLPKRNGARETQRVAAAASGSALPLQWGGAAREVDFFDIKGDVEALLALANGHGHGHGHENEIKFSPGEHPALHPGRCAQLLRGRESIGHLGQLHPRHQRELGIEQPVYLFEMDMAALARARLPKFAAVSRYPAVRRDLAVEAGADVAAQDVLDAARRAAGELLVDLQLFDIYQGARLKEGRKSLAFRLTFQSDSGNLTAEEVDAKTADILQALQRELGARLRA